MNEWMNKNKFKDKSICHPFVQFLEQVDPGNMGGGEGGHFQFAVKDLEPEKSYAPRINHYRCLPKYVKVVQCP